MNFQHLERELQQKKLRPVYVIVGEEAFMAHRALTRILATLELIDGEAPLRTSLTGKEATTEKIFDGLCSLSLLGGRPVVMVREAQGLSKKTLGDISEVVTTPVEGSTLILMAKKLDGRSKLMTIAKKEGYLLECKPLYANQIPSWVTIEVERQGKKISQEGARYLADIVGTELGQIADAIERLALFVGERGLIEVKDIESCIAETAQRTVFELTDALGERKLDKSLSMLRNILDHGEAPVMILAMIARHLRILVKARELGACAPHERQVAQYLGVHPFFAKNYLRQAKNFSSQELRHHFTTLSHCDRALKSSRLPAERILERTIMQLCRGLS